MSLNSGWSEIPGYKNRFLTLSIAAIVIFLMLVMRLWYLQVISSERYLILSEKNRIRYIPITAPRGSIYDRNGELLVDNRPAFDVSVFPEEVGDKEKLLDRLSSFLSVNMDVLQRRWEEGRSFPRYRPVPLAEDVSWETMEKIQENAGDLPGVLTEVRPLRSYPYEEMAAHLFGYLGEITERELQSAKYDGCLPGDFVGKGGLEKKLEDYLRGQAGERLVEVDVKGKELRILKTRESVPGNRVFLTLQRDLQLAAEEAFADQAGAAVALNVQTGEVLALVSKPSFNPAVFARGITGKEWIELLRNPRHPLQNKAIQGQYPPGSTFKIVTALAALKAGVVTPETTFKCQGSFHLGNRDFRDWKKEGHGVTDLRKALKQSCDVWFYKVGLDLGIDRLSQTARELGMGEPLGFALEGEKGGLIPTRQWKKNRFDAPWYDGETLIAAIGQGYVLATPLQLAVMTAAVANGGAVLCPQVVKRVEDLAGNVLFEPDPQVIRVVPFAEENLKAVHRGLWSSRLKEIRIAGKTGTAQVVRCKEDKGKDREVPYRFRDHALFVAYAPAEDPQIAVAVVVEHGGHGSSVAAPIARTIFASYFGLEGAEEPASGGD